MAGYCGLGAAALDGMAFGAPAQHAAGEIGDIGKPGLAQDHGGLCRAAAGAIFGNDRPSSPSANKIALLMCSEKP